MDSYTLTFDLLLAQHFILCLYLTVIWRWMSISDKVYSSSCSSNLLVVAVVVVVVVVAVAVAVVVVVVIVSSSSSSSSTYAGPVAGCVLSSGMAWC